MSRTRLAQLLAAGAALFVIAACSEPTGPADPALLASRAQEPQSGNAPSQAELERQIPGFGGFYLDASGNPVVYLTAGAGRGPAEQALGAYLNARGLALSALRVQQARYSWGQLERWYNAATPEALAIAGVVFVDSDERNNRVLIGVEGLAAEGEVRGALSRLGIPDDGVIIERADPILPVATLQNVVDRPVRAGVQINFPGYLCSLGFNALSGSQASFVTASHCTSTQGGVENTPYWQPLQSVDGTQIATEVADPVYFKNRNGCPRGRKCRFSDASRAAYINGVSPALGQIAQTSGANNGSLTITGSFSVAADDCSTIGGCLTTGSTVNKVGRTTGWTRGVITNTCVNTAVSGSQIVQLCQSFVSAGVGAGDSGSDVFVDLGGGNARLAGVLWGGNSNGTMFVFSPFGNVVSELGPLTTH